MFYWFLKWIAIGPVLRLIFRPRVEGEEHVPETGPAILASNHLSYADWLFMPLTLPRRVTFVAKAEYFTTPGIKGWFQRKFFSGAGQVPIDRSGATAAEGALTSARRILEEGELFGIYPEGTRSHDGRLYRGRTGVARLALETGVPVIPHAAVAGFFTVAPVSVTNEGQNPFRQEKSLLHDDWSMARLRPSSVSTGTMDTQFDCTPQSPQPSQTSVLMKTRLLILGKVPRLRRRRFSAAQVCT